MGNQSIVRGWLGCVVIGAMLIAGARQAAAEEPAEARHTVYLELFGKAGLWGPGYDYQLDERWSLGAALSASHADDQTVLAASPYVGLHPLGRGRHAWFAHAGPQLAYTRTASPVPEWDGASSTGIGGQLSSGYEYRGHLVVRAYLTVTFGRGGVEPWGGVTLGYGL